MRFSKGCYSNATVFTNVRKPRVRRSWPVGEERLRGGGAGMALVAAS